MFKFIKRMFGLDYNNSPSTEKHSGVGYAGVENSTSNPVVENKTAPVESTTKAVKKPRKPRAKKSN
jgi:hypothetical protein